MYVPLAGIQAVRTDNDGYTESGAGIANLTAGGLTANTLTTFLGGQATTKMSTSWGALTPLVKIEWEHDLLQGPISTPALLGGVSFTTETPRETPNGALVVVAATLQRSDNFSVHAEYDGDIRSDYASHAGLIKAEWNF
jgi:outer membrane autotransporter protein